MKQKIEKLRLTDKQFETELKRCEYCSEKPCKEACPVDCSPFDFIKAALGGESQDLQRSASMIMKNNPLGGICGMVCPDRHCMSACSRKLMDGSINIPALQAEIVHRARQIDKTLPGFSQPEDNGRKVAVIGAGPAGLGAAAVLAQRGYTIDLFESRDRLGGMADLIPSFRLDEKMLSDDLDFLKSLGKINIKLSAEVDSPAKLMEDGYSAVICTTGLWEAIMPGVDNESLALNSVDYLSDPGKYEIKGRVAVIGGGATALDCAVIAKKNGAAHVEMISLENLAELPLTERERAEMLEYSVELSGRTRMTSILEESGKIKGIVTEKVTLKPGEKFSLASIVSVEGSSGKREDIDTVIIAIGNRNGNKKQEAEGIFYAGDCNCGPTTVVEAVASGKNKADEVDAYLNGKAYSAPEKEVKSTVMLKTYSSIPVSLETDFFGRKISTPFLLSAAPPSDGYDQMRAAYEAGWSGGVMKTAFDGVPIHIPGEYMHSFSKSTYGNCDNVSGHSLSRVCSEVEKLIKEYPDRLTMASTGGPVTGNDEEDMKGWQSNTKKLESSGVMGIEYSLSCPQGGDGTEGDIVSQNAELTARIIDWIMQAGSADVPKLFKLTAAVTSIIPIIKAIKEVLDRYPDKAAGVTLANTFPVMDFKDLGKKEWENGVLYGMSGEGVAPISYSTLANAVPLGVAISGNGGPMNYKQAANFLALGVKTVQFCTIVTRDGYGIIDELNSGVSYLMKKRNITSMDQLIGIAQPEAITDFMALTPEKKISSVDRDLCLSCGNCTRCPYMAISLDEDKKPVIDPEKCIGCSICTKKCFSGALEMRERTAEEKEKLKED